MGRVVMPGKRILDEGICIDKRLNSVSEGAENLFYRMLTKTDDKGNIFSDPQLIAGQVYPRRKNITETEIKKRLLELHNAKNDESEEEISDEERDCGLIDIYRVKGEFYAHFPNFKKHQKLRKDIALKIMYPLRTCNNSLRTCNDPFTQVSKISKISKVSKQVSKDETANFKKLFKKPEALKSHLQARGLGESRIKDIIQEIFGNKE